MRNTLHESTSMQKPLFTSWVSEEVPHVVIEQSLFLQGFNFQTPVEKNMRNFL